MDKVMVEYRKIGQLPTCLGNERIHISMDGRLFYSRNTRDCEEGQLWSDDWQEIGQLEADEAEKLARAITECGLFELETHWVNEDVEGGKREELDVAIGARSSHFVVRNGEPPEFREFVALLWAIVFTGRLEERCSGKDHLLRYSGNPEQPGGEDS